MGRITKSQLYRDVIDALVQACREGQGQMGAQRARAGIWNANATPDRMQDQHAINMLLKRLSVEEREVLATMLTDEVVRGVFESLKVLEESGIEPFQDGYEGSPFHDFIGRLNDWDWPEN
jgi:FixJ family two-component response regulator